MAVRAYVDTSRAQLIAGDSGNQVVKNRKTGELAIDQATGQVMWAVNLSVIQPPDPPQVWKVKVVGEPKGIQPGHIVKVSGLYLSDWDIEGKHGIAFRAESIAVASPPSGRGS
jgi:hypothetical protein